MSKWVFVYGSLIDRGEMLRTIGLEEVERRRARISGKRLAINKWSTCRDSLVLGLEEGGECEGYAYRIPERSLLCIDQREGYKNESSGYLRKEIPILLIDDKTEVSGFTYVTNLNGATYRKKPKISEIKDKEYFRHFLLVARKNNIRVPKNVADLLYQAGICDLCDVERLKYLTHSVDGTEYCVNRCVYQDGSCIVVITRDYFVQDHLIVIFKRRNKHPDDLLDLTPSEFASMIPAIRAGCDLISKDDDVERVYVASLNEYNHVHFHLVPRRKSDMKGFAFLGGGEYCRGRSSWEKLNDEGRIRRIENIRAVVGKLGRNCSICPDNDCSDRSSDSCP